MLKTSHEGTIMRSSLPSFIFVLTVNIVAVIYNHLVILRFVNLSSVCILESV